MCNQCQDLRAIHHQEIVYGVFHNGRFTMAFKTESQAVRTKELMLKEPKCIQCNGDNCEWTVYGINRKEITWGR